MNRRFAPRVSRRDDRRRAQADAARGGNEDERAARASVEEPPPTLSTADPHAWASACAGWRAGFHERVATGPDGRWRCRWCAQWFNPPPRRGGGSS